MNEINWRKVYQDLYNDEKLHYGKAGYGRCPGVRLLRFYEKYLESPVADLGCGTGDTVFAMRKKGFQADGYDFIKDNFAMHVRDITKLMNLKGYKTVICIDVVEHLEDGQLEGLFENMAQVPRQIISAHNGPSKEGKGLELHINKKEFDKWEEVLERHFDIEKTIVIFDFQRLYICKAKNNEQVKSE